MVTEEFFENIQQQFYNNLPFVVYRKPNEVLVKAMLQLSDKIHEVKNYSEKGFVFAPFDAVNNAILIPFDNASTIESHYEVSSESENSQIISEASEVEKNHHKNLVRKGIDAIESKDFKKVVLSRKETVKLSEINPIKIFQNLIQNYPTAFVSCWYHPKVGLWLGATPETLIKTEGSRFKTMALAGTQKYNETVDVSWNNKEKEEQQFVTDFISSSLESSVNTIKISDVETVKAGSLLHLKTTITGTFNFQVSSLKQVIEALHPTPAVCGMPKENAKQFILNNENYNREFYTGFLGELNLQEKITRNSNRRNVENNAYASVKKISNLYVNLRCMQLVEKTAHIYVGGGITKDSNPEAEWQETVAKTEVMKKVLQ